MKSIRCSSNNLAAGSCTSKKFSVTVNGISFGIIKIERRIARFIGLRNYFCSLGGSRWSDGGRYIEIAGGLFTFYKVSTFQQTVTTPFDNRALVTHRSHHSFRANTIDRHPIVFIGLDGNRGREFYFAHLSVGKLLDTAFRNHCGSSSICVSFPYTELHSQL